jgi:hypothetical protein
MRAPRSTRHLRDALLARGVDAQVLRRLGRYVTGMPTAHAPWSRIRRLSVPGLALRRQPGSRVVTVRVPMAAITTPWGFSFHPDGWHPYVATLRECEATHRPPVTSTSLFTFYKRYTPGTVQDALLEDVSEPLEPLCSWPSDAGLLNVWSLTPERVQAALSDLPNKHNRPRQFIGPHPEWWIREDVARLSGVLRSMRTHGYAPERFDGARITGYFLARGADVRFVCRHGSHRLAVLAHLGYEDVEVMVAPHVTPVVSYDDLEWWSVDRGGLYPMPVAEQLFLKMFHETGRTKATNLGIPID